MADALAGLGLVPTDEQLDLRPPPATQAEWVERLSGSVPADQVTFLATIFADIAKQDTPEFRRKVQPVVTRMRHRLKTFEDAVLAGPERRRAAYDLARPRSFLNGRWTRSPFAALYNELKNFRLADPDAAEGDPMAKDGGTSWLQRVLWALVCTLPYAIPAATAAGQHARLYLAIMSANASRGFAILTGKVLDTLSNAAVMLDHFADWIMPTVVGPPIFQVGPTFDPSSKHLLNLIDYNVGTLAGATFMYLMPNYLPTWIDKLSDFLWKTADPAITDQQGQAAVRELIEGLKLDKTDLNNTRDAYTQRNLGWLGDQSKINAAASEAVSQWNNAIDKTINALAKSVGDSGPGKAAPVEKFPGEQWAQYGMVLFTGLLFAARIGTAIVEQLLVYGLSMYAAYGMIKMWINAGGARIPIPGTGRAIPLPGDQNKRFSDTANSFSNLAANGMPQLIVAIVNLVLKKTTGMSAVDSDIGFVVILVGLTAINLGVGSHIGPVGSHAGLRAIEKLTRGRFDLIPREFDTKPVEIRPTTRLDDASAEAIRAFLHTVIQWSSIPAEPVPEDLAHPTEDETALAGWQAAAEQEIYRQAGTYLLPMIAERGTDNLGFDPKVFLDHLRAFALPALLRARTTASFEATVPPEHPYIKLEGKIYVYWGHEGMDDEADPDDAVSDCSADHQS
ncbi:MULTISPECIES: hypothetical protein [unclassified Neorhizobium]|uniref:hypothetical protein n=1 Tax=unclassified Neorhizobium TaxID=2629175 RepID=UPI001FF50D28|nr:MULTISPECIES: hypothetical protein [unclassified Neorhizobium]MCJ9670359.1 hypothetical protein [Neorhizobium sp. SHOUNA12B]MCJ9746613.1 hypothetical protein [Neorhizobium sp. SHOUNA12A]